MLVTWDCAARSVAAARRRVSPAVAISASVAWPLTKVTPNKGAILYSRKGLLNFTLIRYNKLSPVMVLV